MPPGAAEAAGTHVTDVALFDKDLVLQVIHAHRGRKRRHGRVQVAVYRGLAVEPGVGRFIPAIANEARQPTSFRTDRDTGFRVGRY